MESKQKNSLNGATWPCPNGICIVVEDDPDSREMLALMPKDHGYAVVLAKDSTGDDAHEVFELHPFGHFQ